MPLHSHHRSSLSNSNKSSSDEAEDETVVEPDQGNVLSHIISQLRPGADLSRVTLPTFILEPRSMLERITNFMAHPETLLPMPEHDDPLERFVSVVKFYLSGWHIKPPYEIFTLTESMNRRHSRLLHLGTDVPPSAKIQLLLHGARASHQDRRHAQAAHILTQPNMYARGILFGKMKYELGDHSFIKCPENHLVCDVEFKTKGYFSGTYNAIAGTIKNDQTGEVYYEISGLWNGEMYLKNHVVGCLSLLRRDIFKLTISQTGKKELLFDASHAKHTVPLTRPLEEQSERESQKLWHSTVQGLNARNHEAATSEKTKIEDQQREEAAKRAEENVEWRPRLFRAVRGGPGGSEEGEEDLDWIINAEV
ncbi:hypothetical protein UA08_00093 [Talaromyces atroroseus]|uniref:Oxysterol-binding protein-like protein OBPalpha n=1 Tax=Talaromyces atroroseus TaxID=1441469 RepID=A0A225B991_TALAT|nr:hypothetical protein UA08_00093 [Talaromyces atroroseus]OKL64659.1 hypothetical protein UA08_00093 [Talaromyces atroroseus]